MHVATLRGRLDSPRRRQSDDQSVDAGLLARRRSVPLAQRAYVSCVQLPIPRRIARRACTRLSEACIASPGSSSGFPFQLLSENVRMASLGAA